MPAKLVVTQTGSKLLLECSDEWLCATVSEVGFELEKLPHKGKTQNLETVIFDFSNLHRIDTVAATLLLFERKRLSLLGYAVHFQNPNNQTLPMKITVPDSLRVDIDTAINKTTTSAEAVRNTRLRINEIEEEHDKSNGKIVLFGV